MIHRITLDKAADAAYIHLVTIADSEAAKTCCGDPAEVQGIINLNLNSANPLIGIEVLGASKRLPNGILDAAEVIGSTQCRILIA